VIARLRIKGPSVAAIVLVRGYGRRRVPVPWIYGYANETIGKGGVTMFALKRAYEKAGPADGTRFLVERLYPRGVKKTDLRIEGWLKDVAPSDGLRRWFGHDPEKWPEFRRRYFAELDSHPEGLERLRNAARHGRVTLVYSAHDTEHNNAVALKEYLEAYTSQKRRTSHA
jgi:uncharacterized protein YeaO (DUF488 family)